MTRTSDKQGTPVDHTEMSGVARGTLLHGPGDSRVYTDEMSQQFFGNPLVYIDRRIEKKVIEIVERLRHGGVM